MLSSGSPRTSGYDVRLIPHAKRDLRNVARRDKLLVATAIKALGTVPRPATSQKVKGSDEVYRDRTGVWRIFYVPVDAKKAVVIIAVRRRKENTYMPVPQYATFIEDL